LILRFTALRDANFEDTLKLSFVKDYDFRSIDLVNFLRLNDYIKTTLLLKSNYS